MCDVCPSHCQSCFSLACTDIHLTCPLLKCRNDGCVQYMHRCKADDHATICPFERVGCVNAAYGCPQYMCRRDINSHIEVCPASVVVCQMGRSRLIVPVEEGFRYNCPGDTPRHDPLSPCSIMLDLYFEDMSKWQSTSTDSQSVGDERGVTSPAAEAAAAAAREVMVSKSCKACARLGRLCMYDLMEAQRKPFWQEARDHFNSPTSGDSATSGGYTLSFDTYFICALGSKHREGFKKARTKQDLNEYHTYCDKVMRRSEMYGHYMLYHVLVQELQPAKCPNWNLGCTFQAHCWPTNMPIYYDTEKAAINFRSASVEELEERSSGLCLDELPGDILLEVASHLDSISLHNLSAVCRRLREVCYSLLETTGMVQVTWQTDPLEKSVWHLKSLTWSFSTECEIEQRLARITPHMHGAALTNHKASCQFDDSVSYDNAYPPVMIPLPYLSDSS